MFGRESIKRREGTGIQQKWPALCVVRKRDETTARSRHSTSARGSAWSRRQQHSQHAPRAQSLAPETRLQKQLPRQAGVSQMENRQCPENQPGRAAAPWPLVQEPAPGRMHRHWAELSPGCPEGNRKLRGFEHSGRKKVS